MSNQKGTMNIREAIDNLRKEALSVSSTKDLRVWNSKEFPICQQMKGLSKETKQSLLNELAEAKSAAVASLSRARKK
jgi:hypothetical protein